jgi:hypothetical protein
MGWINPASGQDAMDYAFLSQFPRAIRERTWAAGGLTWPVGNFAWSSGTITAASDNGDGSFTLTHAGDGTAANRFFGFTGHSPTPANYDVIIDDLFDETQVIHLHVYGSTSTTLKVDSSTDHILLDLATGAFHYPAVTTAALIAAMVGKTYHVIRQNGEWWHERWLAWPNDQEQWADLALTAGALQPVTSLTGDGMTTATAVVTGHQFVTGDNVTIAGAVSSGSQFNGTFSVTVVDADTFTYTLASPDDLVATGTITAQCTAVGAHDASASFPLNAWASGYQLMVAGSDTLLKRITLTGNDATNLYFARQSYTVSGQYGVVAALNTLGNPSRWRFYGFIDGLCSYNDMHSLNSPYAGPPFAWYNSRFDNYWTRLPTNPTDTVGGTKLPAISVTLNTISGAQPFACFDVDLWTDPTDTLNPADKNYTPDLYRTIHGWQLALENLVGDIPNASAWVAPVNHEGSTATVIPSLVRATWFSQAGINSQTGATGSLDNTGGVGGIDISGFSFPYFPINVYYAVINADGSVQSAGTGSCDRAGHLNKDSGSFGTNDQSRTCVISLGWTRIYRNAFLYLYRKQCWVPTPDAITGNPIDPPTSANPGTWTNRNASAKYKECNPVGIVNDANGFRSFVSGATGVARYDGDNWNDPTIHPEILTSDTHGFQGYYNNFYEGVLDPTHQAALVASMSGTVTASDTMWIADNTKNWWPGGVLHTESGTATGGSTTDLTDTGKNGNGFWGLSAAGMLGFAVKVTISGIDYYRVVTAHFGNSPAQIFWGDALPSSASGQAYEVRWPKYEADRWRGRTLTLVYPDATVHTLTISDNDDQRLYFTALASAPPVGSTYTITENTPGGVWQWNGSAWIVPPGNDPRNGLPWLTDPTANEPTYTTNYGRALKGDEVTIGLFNELKAAANALIHTKANALWTGGGANNAQFGQDNGNISFAGGSGAQDNAKANYAASSSGANANPFAAASTRAKCNGGGSIACYDYAVGRRYAYGTATNAVNIQSSGSDWYAYSNIAGNASNGGWSGSSPSGSCPAIATWDDEGDGLLQGAWHKYSADGPNNSSSRQSGTACGNTGLPTPADIGPAPAVCPTDCSWIDGYVVNPNGMCIFRWNVSGGFDFV